MLVDNDCQYYRDGEPRGCGEFTHWDETDLTGERFFDFTDVKPGDYGENTISLHVVDNDAWACVTISPLSDNENVCIDPELEDGDNTCGNPGNDLGELSQYLEFFAWIDDGDNLYNSDVEVPIFTNVVGTASDVLSGRTYTLSDSFEPGIGPLVESETYWIGIAWCAGTLTVTPGTGNMTGNPNLSCDGSSMGNLSQTDSLTGDISFYVEQSRNNDEFTCEI